MTSNSEPFRTQVPNIIDDLGLDPFERALYVHYKRTCGENPQGYSNETVQTIHLKLKMGAGQVSEARKSLVERGLIRMQNTHPVVVTVIDIWDLNRGYYGLEREYRPDVDGWTIEQVKVWLCDMSSDIHKANVSSHNDNDIPSSGEQDLTEYNEHSPSEQDQPTVNVSIHKDNNMSSNIHKAKQRISSESKESNPSKESKELSPKQKLFLTLADLCHIELRAASEKQKGQLGNASKALVNLVTDTDQFKEKFPVYWAAMDWRGKKGQSPEPPQIQESYGDYCYWLKNGASTPPQNGASHHGTHQRSDKRGIKALEQTGESAKGERTIDINTHEYVYPDGHREPVPPVPGLSRSGLL